MNRFDWVSLGSEEVRPHYDIPVRETDNFVVLPSLGSLVSGWVLIVPKRRLPNLSYLDVAERQEMKQLIQQVHLILAKEDETVYAFEHGGPYGSLINCGVDQAHLHLVPLGFNLLDLALRQPDVSWKVMPRSQQQFNEKSNFEYLSVSNLKSGQTAFGKLSETKSQWFRKLIARELNTDKWDYKTHPEYSMLWKTASVFGIENA